MAVELKTFNKVLLTVVQIVAPATVQRVLPSTATQRRSAPRPRNVEELKQSIETCVAQKDQTRSAGWKQAAVNCMNKIEWAKYTEGNYSKTQYVC